MLLAATAGDAQLVLVVLLGQRAVDTAVRAAHRQAFRRGAQRALPRRTTV